MIGIDAVKKIRPPKEGSREAQLRDMRKTGKLPKHAGIMLDDGAPAAIIRLPGDQPAKPVVRTPATVALSPKESEKKSIEREAAQRWRDWMPSAKHLSRPQQATFRRIIRAERKSAAQAVKLAAKAAASEAKASAKATSQETDMTTKSKKSAKAKARTAVKGKTSSRSRYDWKAAEEKAAAGDLPTALDFSAKTHERFRPALAEVLKAAKAGDVAALKKVEINPVSSSPKALDRFRKLCLKALKAA